MLVAAAMMAMLASQTPIVGYVEIFGLHKIPPERILKAVAVKPGDPLPPSKSKLEDTLLAVEGVARASVEAFCCEGGQAVLYVGIEERGASAFPLRDWPEGDLELPPEIVEVYHDYTIALANAMRESDMVEDISQGHSLMTNIACRVLQERFLGLAEIHLAALRAVLRESEDEEQRAIAAYVLGYAPRKSEVTDDLQLGLRDPDPDVRANALRALRPIAALAQKDPSLGIKVETTWFVEMLNSTVLKDRLEAVRTLLMLTDQGMSASTAAHIRERGLPALEEMAHWRHLEHALPPYLLLGRLAGMDGQQLEQAWASGEGQKELQEIERKLKSKK
ncbi:MAG: HEAT repeat domain-containing protein [Bryobacteraceae bacterium]